MADAAPSDERPTNDRLESLSDDVLARYSRQVLIPELGEDGQRRLMNGRATLIGCGALGTVQAEVLVRAGIGPALFDQRVDFREIEMSRAAARRSRVTT